MTEKMAEVGMGAPSRKNGSSALYAPAVSESAGFSYSIDKTAKTCILLAAYSQGGVKAPTGGSPVYPGSPRAPVRAASRAGSADPVQKPEPTVKVRKKEGKAARSKQQFVLRFASGHIFLDPD